MCRRIRERRCVARAPAKRRGVRVGERAPNTPFLRTDGKQASLTELVGGKPTVLFFLRHYG
jgi:hypothetical protein